MTNPKQPLVELEENDLFLYNGGEFQVKFKQNNPFTKTITTIRVMDLEDFSEFSLRPETAIEKLQ